MFPIPQPSTQPTARPRLVLIQGDKLEDDPLVILCSMLFLIQLRAQIEKNRRRQPEEPTPEPVREDEVTGVHPVLDDAAIERILDEHPLPPKPAKRKGPKVWEVSDEVAGQFARCVLGAKTDLEDFINHRAEKVMTLRMHARQRFKPVKEVRQLELMALMEHVRTVVQAMMPTTRHTKEGYAIRRLPSEGNEAPLEAAVDGMKIMRIYRTARPKRRVPNMVRMRPNRRQLHRS